ncbi:hypothetical protein IAR55_005115 [Kwoniella newhampshirensis]|uniref:Uncharacterized protein n=1 Tax=Kwoniella newhampshirensis TaxID=1651941 RepID=A0AAW0YJG9_9TREE
MPLILASLVFAAALAALPSTEPPDEAEYERYLSYLRTQREKRRKSRVSSGQGLLQGGCQDEKSKGERMSGGSNLDLSPHENPASHPSLSPSRPSSPTSVNLVPYPKPPPRARGRSQDPRPPIRTLSINIPPCSLAPLSHQSQSQNHHGVEPPRHARRSSSVPSCSSAGSSRNGSPTGSPKGFSSLL